MKHLLYRMAVPENMSTRQQVERALAELLALLARIVSGVLQSVPRWLHETILHTALIGWGHAVGLPYARISACMPLQHLSD